jgi:hypothetical protein
MAHPTKNEGRGGEVGGYEIDIRQTMEEYFCQYFEWQCKGASAESGISKPSVSVHHQRVLFLILWFSI